MSTNKKQVKRNMKRMLRLLLCWAMKKAICEKMNFTTILIEGCNEPHKADGRHAGVMRTEAPLPPENLTPLQTVQQRRW